MGSVRCKALNTYMYDKLSCVVPVTGLTASLPFILPLQRKCNIHKPKQDGNLDQRSYGRSKRLLHGTKTHVNTVCVSPI